MSRPFSNPLLHLHRQAEAEFQNYGQIEIVSTFGEPQAEYAAIRKMVGVFDLPQRGFIELTGRDSLRFLDALISAEIFNRQTRQPLPVGKTAYSFMLNLKGRIVTDLTVLSLPDRVVIELDARLAAPFAALLEEYRFAEQVKIRWRGDLHEIAFHGPQSVALLNELTAADAPWAPGSCGLVRVLGSEVTARREDPTGAPGLSLIMPVEVAPAIWMHLIATYGQAGETVSRRLRPVGWAAFNATRIEAGTPLFGIDFDVAPPSTAAPSRSQRQQGESADASGGVLPAETGLLSRAVCLSKCYVGQEIVARMHARGQVAKLLVGIRVDGDALPIAGEQIFDDASNAVGLVTSSTISPVLSNAPICLGFVRRPHFAIGTKLAIPAEGGLRTASVVELPFFP